MPNLNSTYSVNVAINHNDHMALGHNDIMHYICDRINGEFKKTAITQYNPDVSILCSKMCDAIERA